MNPESRSLTLDAQALQCLAKYFEQPRAERERWLEARCAHQSELLRVVRRLIAADEASDDFLEKAHVHDWAAELAGKRIGPYELIEEVGRGGMGAVYRARRADGFFKQEVAIKLFAQGVISDSALQRFITERHILASLEHPGIARLIDGGSTHESVPYVVMELIDGEPITAYCDHHALDLQARLKLFQSVCRALGVAHAKGIVHRDIKPANVLATADGQTKLVDFGIAKLLHPQGPAAGLPATIPALMALTPEYASPEQVRGQDIGVASDIYSLGILLYELLVGSRPYDIKALSPGEVERSVCETMPPDPSRRVALMRRAPPPGLRTGRRLRKTLRGDLDRIVMTALRKAPEQRYHSAAAFSADIERYMHGLPVKARGASKLYRGGRFIARNRLVVTAIVVAFLALLAGLFAVSVQIHEVQIQHNLAEQEADRARTAKDFLVEMIGRADPFENAESTTLIVAIKQSIPGIKARFSGQPELEADMRYAIGYALQNLGEIPQAREQMEKALVLRRAQGSTLDIAEALGGLGIVCWWESDFEHGKQRFEQALDLLAGNTSKRATSLRIDALTNYSGMLIDAGQYQHSVRVGRQALAAAQNAPELSAATQASIWGNIATALESLKQYEESTAAFDKTLELQGQASGEMNPAYAIVLNNQAHLFYAMGEAQKAMANFKQSLRIRRETLAENHPQIATALFNLAQVQVTVGEFKAAQRNGLEALKVAEASYESGHPRIGKAHETLAKLYFATGQRSLAREHALKAQYIYTRAAGVDPAWKNTVDEMLAQIHAAETDRKPLPSVKP